MSENKLCPLTFCTGSPSRCKSDCAWFAMPDGYEEGCCAVTIQGSASNWISVDIEEIAARMMELVKRW